MRKLLSSWLLPRAGSLLLAVILLLGLAACQGQATHQASEAQAASGVPVKVGLSSVALDPNDPTRRILGKLTLVSCVELTCGHPGFGGWSGLRISTDGTKLLAVSDQGWWLRAGLKYNQDGSLSQVTNARLGRLVSPDGNPLPPDKTLVDAEEVVLTEDRGLLVSFERTHRLWLYPAPGWDLGHAPRPTHLPAWLAGAPDNDGVEAMAKLPDGRLLILTEGLLQNGLVLGAVGKPSAWQPISYQLNGEPQPTGAATLPSGDLVLTERSYSPAKGVVVRVVMLAAASVQPKAVLQPQVLAVLKEPLAVDNFEGIAARRSADGRTLTYLISDDNYSPIQRTLLQIWAIEEPSR